MKNYLLSVFIFFWVTAAKANTIVVQNNNDSSTGSLRQSIIDANDGDTIRFNPNLITSGSNTINLTSEIAFSKELVFKGLFNTTDTLFISGNNTNRIFNITNTAQVAIDSMTFVNGNPTTGGGGALSIAGVQQVFIDHSFINNCSAQYGGAIRFITNVTNSGPGSQIFLDIYNSVIYNNSASSGGGINIGGQNIYLTINNCDIINNLDTDNGGGINAFAWYDGSITVNNSNISNNQVSAGNAGALYAQSFYSDFFTTINNSTFDNNTASGTGGGIYSVSDYISSVIVNNSTISNNTANIAGGIFSGNSSVANSESILTLNTSTLINNHATDDVGGAYLTGNSADFTATNSTIYGNSTATSWNKCGGVQVFGTAFGMANSTINITSSIVSTSVGDNIKHLIVDNGGNIVSAYALNSGGYNLFSDAPIGATGTGDLTNVSDVDLDLQVLANNGGITMTMMPGVNSVAINAGNLNDLNNAQNGAITGIRDIGSTERINTTILVNSITVQGQGGVSTITTQNGTLQMEATVLPANADDMTYSWSVTNGTGSASIDANGLLTAVSNGTVTVIATANDGSGVTGSATITISNQTVGLNEFDLKDISIYPNPATNELFVSAVKGQINQLDIIDYTGRIVKTISEKQVKSIDVSDLSQGVYILKVYGEVGIYTEHFIKK